MTPQGWRSGITFSEFRSLESCVQCLHALPSSRHLHCWLHAPAGFILCAQVIFPRLGLTCSGDSVYCCRTHLSLTVRKLSKGSSLQSRPLAPLSLSLLERYSAPCPHLLLVRHALVLPCSPLPPSQALSQLLSPLQGILESSVRVSRSYVLPILLFSENAGDKVCRWFQHLDWLLSSGQSARHGGFPESFVGLATHAAGLQFTPPED